LCTTYPLGRPNGLRVDKCAPGANHAADDGDCQFLRRGVLGGVCTFGEAACVGRSCEGMLVVVRVFHVTQTDV
jgi:hypothetical protein